MKLSKRQRRFASKLVFPLISLFMMTTAMAIAGTSAAQTASVQVSSP